MKSKHIILFTINDVWYDQRMIKIANEFCKNGHQVIWFARKKSILEMGEYFEFGIHRVKCLYQKGIFFYVEYAVRQFWYLWRNKKFDYLYCCDPDTLPGVFLFNIFSKKKFIFDSHEFYCETPEFQDKPVKKKIWKLVENWGIKNAVSNLTVAPNLALKLEKVYGRPFNVVINSPLNTHVKIPVKKENIIIYQGVLNKGRGLECVIDAMTLLPEFHLWVCGEGDLSEVLRGKASDIANITFFGYLTPSELQQKTTKAKFGINLLDLTSQSYYYSLANKFFDYAASGVVSINSPGIEYLDFEKKYDHSLILNELKPDMLANLIRSLPEDEYLIKVRNGIKMVSENLWKFDVGQLTMDN
jgi:hypothetical protein